MNATANTASNENPITRIISQVMNSATQEGNRQAALTVALFASEASFSADAILRVMRKEGADKSEAVDNMLSALSEDFTNAADYYTRLSDKDYRKTLDGSAKEKNIFEADALLRKIRAARKMFGLALSAVYYLRVNKAVSVKTNNVGTGSLAVLMPTPEFPDHPSVQRVSNNSLAASGDKLIREKLGKGKREPRANNPQGDVLSNATKSLAAIAPKLREPINGNGKVQGAGTENTYDRLDETSRANLEVIFKNVFAAKFFDGTVFDERSFRDWMNETFKAEKEAAAKTNAGKDKEGKEGKEGKKAA